MSSVVKNAVSEVWKRLVIGTVASRGLQKHHLRVRCNRLEMDTYIHKYYNEQHYIWAIERETTARIGDIILIEQLPEPIKKVPPISHEVKDIVYPVGNVIDPVTGRRCRGTVFIDTERRSLEEQIIEEKRKKTKANEATLSSVP